MSEGTGTKQETDERETHTQILIRREKIKSVVIICKNINKINKYIDGKRRKRVKGETDDATILVQKVFSLFVQVTEKRNNSLVT